MPKLDFSKVPAQSFAFEHFKPGNTVTLAWGRGLGKSWFIRQLWYLLVSEWDGRPRLDKPGLRGVRIHLLMPTLTQTKKIHANLMVEELEGEWKFLRGRLNKTEWKVSFPGGSYIQWISAENAQFNRGIRTDVLTIDEADDVDKELVSSIMLPWFSEPGSLKQTIIAGTPRKGRKGLLYEAYKNWPELDSNRFSSHATAYDAPLIVDPDYIEKVKVLTPPEIFKREWLCDFDSAEGLVYPEFCEDFHVREPDPRTVYREYIGGIDFGYEDPAVMLVFGVVGSGRDTQVHLLEEVYAQHLTDSDLSEVAKRIELLYPKCKWYADPSRPQSIESLRREAGIRIIKANNKIEDGVATVSDAIRIRSKRNGEEFAKLYIAPSAENTIRELGLYRRKRDSRNQELVLEDVEDKNNHAMDAMRYALTTHFGGPQGTLRNL